MNYSITYKNKIISWPKVVLVIAISFYMIHYLANLSDWYFIDNVNLIFHEAGHFVFIFFGSFLNILGGTLMQLLIPIIFCFYFYKNEQYFSASLLLFWLGQNFINISIYAGDAVRMELPLLGGDNVYHDWNTMLSSLHILNYTDQVSSLFYFSGIIIIIFAFIYSIKFSFKQNDVVN